MRSVADIANDGICVGCGICAFNFPHQIRMEMNEDGHYAPFLNNAIPENLENESLYLCPMSGEGLNESDISKSLWPELPDDERIGRYRSTIAAHVSDEGARISSGSGGLASWIATELLRLGEIDCVLHVREGNGASDAIFAYSVSRTPEEVRSGSKAKYYPIEMSRVLSEISGNGERVAVIGLPCFIKALRKSIMSEKLNGDQFKYFIGLVCGHLKSKYFADYLAWQSGVEPRDLAWCDFRYKLEDRPASHYGFASRAKSASPDAPPRIVPMGQLKAKDWGEGQMRLLGCEFCDDVLAECADIAIGDAWLPEFVEDYRGENVAVVRDARLARIIEDGVKSGDLITHPLTLDDVAKSQASGIRHRREGLAHRLARRRDAGRWAPKKRVEPNLAPTEPRRRIYDLRQTISEISNKNFSKAMSLNDMAIYETSISKITIELKKMTYGSIIKKIITRIRNLIPVNVK